MHYLLTETRVDHDISEILVESLTPDVYCSKG